MEEILRFIEKNGKYKAFEIGCHRGDMYRSALSENFRAFNFVRKTFLIKMIGEHDAARVASGILNSIYKISCGTTPYEVDMAVLKLKEKYK